MLTVKLKVNKKRFFIPVPYPFIYMVGWIATSKRITRLINNEIKKDGSKFVIPEIEWKDLKLLLRVFSKHSGLVLVETKSADGTEVKVKL